jgi:hypothetical protein
MVAIFTVLALFQSGATKPFTTETARTKLKRLYPTFSD